MFPFNSRVSSRRLACERLEARQMMAVYLSGGDIVINQTNGHDVADVSFDFARSQYVVTDNSIVTRIHSSRVTGGDVFYYGHEGHDLFNNNTDLRTIARGGGGDDKLYANSYANVGDYLLGGSGHDTLSARGGDDMLWGESGNDTLMAGDGNDQLMGGTDHDTLWAGAGVDKLWGESGNDWLHGGDDNDYDYFYGGLGADRFERRGFQLAWSSFDRVYDFSSASGDRVVDESVL